MLDDPNNTGGEFGNLLDFPDINEVLPPAPQYVGAPTELADSEEMPNWVGDLVKGMSVFPLLVGFLCGGLPAICGILWCIVTLLF
jgi:hypothetical protein